MDEPRHPQPNRRKRIVLPFAALVVAVSALGVAYCFMRPPELVWWTSPPVGKSARHVKVLIPSGWEIAEDRNSSIDLTGTALLSYYAYPIDTRPALLRRIMPRHKEDAGMLVFINSDVGRNHAAERPRLLVRPVAGANATPAKRAAVTYGAAFGVNARDSEFCAMISYYRADQAAYNRTYKQICSSLRIE